MSWKQTQTQEAADEGVEAVMMFMNERVSAHHLGPDEGSSQSIPNLPNLTLNLSKVSSYICISYIYLIFSHILHVI